MQKVLLIALVILIGAGAYFLGKNQLVSNKQVQTVYSSPTPDLTANWKTYTDNKYGFIFKYPNTANIKSEFNPSVPAGIADVESTSFMVNDQGYEVITYINSMKNCHGTGNVLRNCNDVKDWISTSFTAPNDINSYDQIIVDNKIAYKERGLTSVYVANGKSVYFIEGFKPYAGPLKIEDTTYDNFLQSIKFTQ